MKTVKPLTSPVEVDEVIDHQPHAFGLGAGHQGARELARHAEDAIGLQAGGRAARHHEVHGDERRAGVRNARDRRIGRGSIVLEAQEIGRRPSAARDRGVASLVREGAATAGGLRVRRKGAGSRDLDRVAVVGPGHVWAGGRSEPAEEAAPGEESERLVRAVGGRGRTLERAERYDKRRNDDEANIRNLAAQGARGLQGDTLR